MFKQVFILAFFVAHVALTNLFNKIIRLEQISINFKSGLTVTLHKGKGKSTADPNNYMYLLSELIM